MNKKQNENGRSMVEMLGVLAVIGVLSIGGIQGYTYAMNKYRSNNILNELNMASQDLGAKLLTSRNATKMITLGNPYDMGQMTTEAFPFAYGCGNYGSESKNCHQDETGYWTTISNVPEEICKNMLSKSEKLPNLVQKKLNGEVVEDGTNCGENNEITLLFNADGTGQLAKNCGTGNNNQENTEEPPLSVSCPANTSREGLGGLAVTLTDEPTGKTIDCYCLEVNTKYDPAGTCVPLSDSCTTNAGCNRGDYCDITNYKPNNSYCTKDTSNMTGECRNAKADLQDKPAGAPFWMSNRTMRSWSAVHFCQALGKKVVTLSDYGCAHTMCSSGCDAQWGYCHATTEGGQRVNSSTNLVQPTNVEKMYTLYDNFSNQTWIDLDYNTCYTYYFQFNKSKADLYGRSGYLHAVCK